MARRLFDNSPVTSAMLLQFHETRIIIFSTMSIAEIEKIGETLMNFFARHSAKSTDMISMRPPRVRSAKECGECGNAIFIPEWSEWRDSGHARHLWKCDACGCSFETEVYFAAA